MSAPRCFAMVLAGLLGLCSATRSQDEPSWIPTFGPRPGMGGPINAFTVFDDGTGPALYAGGNFDFATSDVAAKNVARWDGVAWSPLGTGVDGDVQALTVFDDGAGPALYAGVRRLVGGSYKGDVTRWDGTRWEPLGTGMNFSVCCLTVFDDGGGPALYAGGSFSSAGGVAAVGIARWDGSSWSAVGSGLGGAAWALAVFDDGGGPALFAGGYFTTAAGAPPSRMARWDGTSWSALGSGVDDVVYALTVHDDGSGAGPALYAGGRFTTVGGTPAERIARWDGTSWSSVGGGMNDDVLMLGSVDDGTGVGETLVAGGDFTSADGPARRIARWDGSSWSALGGGMDRAVLAVAVFPAAPGGPPSVWAGGEFILVEGSEKYYVATFRDESWWPLGDGLGYRVQALEAFDDGSGLALFAGGDFGTIGGGKAENIAKWDGSTWSPLGAGVSGSVLDLAVFDDGLGGGPGLYVAGWFSFAGGATANNIARWDGTAWSTLDNGLSNFVTTLAVFDDGTGSGPALYAGGGFMLASGVPARFVARWDGTSWSSLGLGASSRVFALAVLDHASGGPALYAGGIFQTIGGVFVDHVAKWDGASWSALGDGLPNAVYALAVYDDGGGPAVHAGGYFGSGGGLPNVAKWDGSAWSALGSGVTGTVGDLAVFDDGTGSGPALYAAGQFWTPGLEGNHIARWDGTSWSTLGNGLSELAFALEVYDDHQGGGRSLYVGSQGIAPDSGDQFLARWGRPPPPWIDVGGGTRGLTGPPRLSLDGPLTPGSTLTLDLVGAAPLSPALVFVALQSTPQPFLGGTLHAFPTSELATLATNVSGEIHRAALFGGAITGSSLWLQVAIADPSVPIFGASLSNGVKGTVP